MKENYQTFKTFTDRQTAENFAEVLNQNGISFFIEEDKLMFDPSYAHNPLNKDYAIKLAPQDFLRASKAYENYFSALLETVSEDYYLFSFSDKELWEIVAKPDEWGSFDYLLAQKILEERGIIITEKDKEILREKRLHQLAKPEEEKSGKIIGYYILSLIFFPAGIVIGWVWGYSKKNLPNGSRVYAYSEKVQKHGRIIFGFAVFLFILTITWRVLVSLSNEH